MEVLINLDTYAKNINVNERKTILENISKEHHYSIIDLEKNEQVGKCAFTDIDHLNQSGEIGIYIGNKDYWNKGYGTEALTLLLDYGFKALNFHNIQLKVYSFNERAIKSYEKIGFKTFGKRREALLGGKERYDIIHMDILYDEFYEKNKIMK